MRSLRKNLETVPGKHSIDSLQKTAILGTTHIIWKVLQCEAYYYYYYYYYASLLSS